MNAKTTEDLVELIEICGQQRLVYKAFSIQICFIGDSYCDEAGNITLEREVAPLEAISIAQATKNSGGIVIVQVEKIVKEGTLDPKLVKIPRIYVDGVVVAQPQDHEQCFGFPYDPSLSGEIKISLDSLETPPLTAKKIIGRRAAMELKENSVVNLGIGIAEYISMVANEEGIGDYMTLTVEAGPVGGVPQGGAKIWLQCQCRMHIGAAPHSLIFMTAAA